MSLENSVRSRNYEQKLYEYVNETQANNETVEVRHYVKTFVNSRGVIKSNKFIVTNSLSQSSCLNT